MKHLPCTIKEAARLAGVSVRTLHHYDAIGLLVPKLRSSAGYRLYDQDDLLRLQQILIGRELGFALQQIGRSLDDPAFDLAQALRAQRQQLQGRAQRTGAMLRAVDAALAILDSETGDDMDMKNLFDGFDPSAYEDETRQRWGNTDACKESARRTSRYSAEDWARFKEEQAAVYGAAATAMTAGTPPDDPAAMEMAERHRLLIDRWFYSCSKAMHRGLADLYEADTRFAQNIERHGKGLTAFLAAAIRANAADHRPD